MRRRRADASRAEAARRARIFVFTVLAVAAGAGIWLARPKPPPSAPNAPPLAATEPEIPAWLRTALGALHPGEQPRVRFYSGSYYVEGVEQGQCLYKAGLRQHHRQFRHHGYAGGHVEWKDLEDPAGEFTLLPVPSKSRAPIPPTGENPAGSIPEISRTPG